jgi:hypothetical protein
MFTAIIYKQTITSKTLRGLKMLASKIANRYRNSIDEMQVTNDLFPDRIYKMTRINKKCPNNTITYGQWN